MRAQQFWQADSSFAPVLESSAPGSTSAVPDAIVRQPDGKLIVAGPFGRINGVTFPGYALARLLPSGATDSSFSGQITERYISWLRLQPGGKIVASGLSATNSITYARFTAQGARDTFYLLDTIIASEWPGPGSLEMASDGNIYGQPLRTRFSGGVLVRYTPDGYFDSTFRNSVDPSGSLIAPLPDGTVVTTQMADSYLANSVPGQLIHLTHDGTKDPGFAFESKFLPGRLIGLVALPDKRVLAIETIQTDYGETFDFLRVGLDGKPDYRYRAKVGVPLSSASVSTLAGVLFDMLRDANAPANASLQLDFRPVTAVGSVSTASISVGADGACYAASPAGFSKLLRTSASGPSVDATPVILSGPSETTTINRNQGESFSISATGGGLEPLSYQWMKDGVPVTGATSSTLSLSSVTPADAGTYSLVVSNPYGTVTTRPVTLAVNAILAAPTILNQPVSQSLNSGPAGLYVQASGNPAPTYDWFFNGTPLPFVGSTGSSAGGITSSALVIQNFDSSKTGIYYAVANNSAGRVTSSPAILGLTMDAFTKVTGTGAVWGTDIVHPNGNVYDQVLLQGPATTIRADAGKVTRLSFIDLNDDIVQVEFAGAGALSLVLDDPSGPAPAANYNQAVNYMKGHAGIVITGANETTNVSVFSVGRATAFDPTGAYNILQPPGVTNDPAHNGSPLFIGHDGTTYDGVADLAFIAITSTNGKFGGVHTANASYHAIKGLTGVYAPGVQFAGPVYVGDINAFDAAMPVLMLGSAATTQINGGDLLQSNGQALKVSGITELKFVDGSTSQGVILPAQTNKATLDQNGVDVTAQLVGRPGP